MTRARRSPVAWLGLAVSLLVWPSGAVAAPGTFALQVTNSRAAYFVLSSHGGASAGGEVTVINVGQHAGGVSLYPTDATTGQTSGAVYQSGQQPRRGVGAWIRLAQRHVTLGARQSTVVPFRVVIPRGVRGGQHLGGIVAQPDQPRARLTKKRGKAAFHVQVRAVAIIAVQLNLPGRLTRRLAITGIRTGAQPGYQTLMLGLASTGSALTKGAGKIIVRDSSGRRRLHQSFALDTFVPHTQIKYPIHVRGRALGAGLYKATITITAAGHRVTRVLTFAITAKNLNQTFGSRPTAGPSSSGENLTVLIVGGAMVLLAGLALGARIGIRRTPSA
jgi:hypothetical protein